MITYLVAAFSSPLIGLLVDKVGFKRYFIVACLFLFMLAQFILLVYPQCDEGGFPETGSITALVFIGLAFALYGNCLVPSISLVVKKKITGTAFGIMQMI